VHRRDDAALMMPRVHGTRRSSEARSEESNNGSGSRDPLDACVCRWMMNDEPHTSTPFWLTSFCGGTEVTGILMERVPVHRAAVHGLKEAFPLTSTLGLPDQN
jgi:hypothetical protein